MTGRAMRLVLPAWEILRRHGWPSMAVFLVHEVCAHGIDAYGRWPAVDIPLHFAGGLAIAYFIAGALDVLGRRRWIREPDGVLRAAVVFGLTCAAAMFWEFAEWLADHTLGTRCQLGLADTLGDLLTGMLGGLMFLAVAGTVRHIRRGSP